MPGVKTLRQGKGYKSEPIDGLNPIPIVVAVPVEIEFNVRQSEQGYGPDRLEVAHSRQPPLQRYGGQLFDLFGAIAQTAE